MGAPHDLLLFDLDGTLSDPVVGIHRSMNHALSHFGFAPIELAQVPIYIGPPLDEAFRTITGVTSPEQLNAFVGKYRERYADVGYAENVLYPGIAEVIAKLSSANVPLAVCTSKRKDFAERILTMFGLESHFRFVSGGEIGVHKWQQVEALLSTGLISKSAVMVGDRAIDMVAAHRNGLCGAGVLWGNGSREELMREQPCYLFGAPSDFPTLLGTGRAHDVDSRCEHKANQAPPASKSR